MTAALNASSFDWSVVPGQVVVHIGKGISSHAVAGEIWLDGALLDSGRFSWGVVQHEYAHQVDFGVLTDSMRLQLQPELRHLHLALGPLLHELFVPVARP